MHSSYRTMAIRVSWSTGDKSADIWPPPWPASFRYDARGYLSDLQSHGGPFNEITFSHEEWEIEQSCNYERYYDLYHSNHSDELKSEKGTVLCIILFSSSKKNAIFLSVFPNKYSLNCKINIEWHTLVVDGAGKALSPSIYCILFLKLEISCLIFKKTLSWYILLILLDIIAANVDNDNMCCNVLDVD